MCMYDKDTGLKGIKGAPFSPPDSTHHYCAVFDWLLFSYYLCASRYLNTQYLSNLRNISTNWIRGSDKIKKAS